jgi:hypothetical protein
MSTIPSGTQFIGLASTVNTVERRSSLINNESAAYTIEDIIDSVPSGGVTSVATTGPITGGTITGSGTIGITQATNSADGYLSSADWNTFNNKQAALVSGTNIKTINGSSVLGSGDLVVGGAPAWLESNATDLTIWNNGKGNVASNTSFGEFALKSNTTSSNNTAIGQYALATNSNGNDNTAIGYGALRYGNNSQQNTAVGSYVLQSANGIGNVGVGMWAGISVVSGQNNTLIGKFSGRSIGSVSNITAVGVKHLRIAHQERH